jgi:hypothetical protein
MEERAAALYRRFAREARPESPYAPLWQEMAREEDEHAAGVLDASWTLPSHQGWRVNLEGWTDAMREIELRLERAEQLPPTASDDDRVSAALEIELGEMDALRHAAIGAACGQRPDDDDDHLSRLAETAAAASSDGHVLALANIARARRRLATAH